MHADKSTSSSALGSFADLGTFRTASAGQLHYDGCAVRVETVQCQVTDEVTHDRCPEGSRVCRRCTGVHATYSAVSSFCPISGTTAVGIGRTVHDCAPCETDPVGDAMTEIKRELVGRILVMKSHGPSFFTTKKACAAGR